MTYGHSHLLASIPSCPCGEPAWVIDDETDEPICARCATRR